MGVPVDMGLVVFVSSGLSAGAGAFIGSYLMKKGENLATHEDINKLVDQVKSVTQATKEIEAKISGELWDRQRHWEAKRDALLSAVKSLSSVDKHFSLFRETVDYGLKNDPPEEQLNRKPFKVVKKDDSEARDMLDEAVLLLTCYAEKRLYEHCEKQGSWQAKDLNCLLIKMSMEQMH
ncbi:MAG: hypothetical protein ACLPHI_12110 [Terriglobales bacterium]|jgi:hypothetical protein